MRFAFDGADGGRLEAAVAPNPPLLSVAQLRELRVDFHDLPRPLHEGRDLRGDEVLGQGHVVGEHDELVDKIVAQRHLVIRLPELADLKDRMNLIKSLKIMPSPE